MTNTHRRFRRATPLLLGLVFGAGSSGYAVDWPMLRGNTQRSGVSEERVLPPLSLHWRFTGTPQRNNPCAPAIVGNTVYFATGSGTAGGVVYALDARTGAQKWRYPSQGGLSNAVFLTAPFATGSSIYIGASDNSLYVLNAATGVLRQQFRARGTINSSPLVHNGVLFFGSNDNTLYALDAQTFQSVWRSPYIASDNINSAPLIAGSLMYFSTSDQYVHAVGVATGITKWRFRLPFSSIQNGPVYADNTLYVPSGPRMHAFQPQGNLRWTVNLPVDISVPAIAAGGVVYVIDRDRRMYALRSNNGREVWAKPAQLPYDAAAAPTISGNVIYVPTVRNKIVALSRDDGRIVWDYNIEPTRSSPAVPAPSFTAVAAPMAIANGTLYALSDDGSLSAFRPDAIDTTPPLADRLFPRPGSMVSGAPPLTFAATLRDPGSGLNAESIKLTLSDSQGNGQELNTTFDASRDLLYYQTVVQTGGLTQALPNGRHTVTLTARDWRGNIREEQWSFVVDNSLPPTVNREQAAPAAPRTPGRPGARPTRPGARPPSNRPGNRRDRRPQNRDRRRGNNRNLPAPPPGANPNTPPPPPASPL